MTMMCVGNLIDEKFFSIIIWMKLEKWLCPPHITYISIRLISLISPQTDVLSNMHYEWNEFGCAWWIEVNNSIKQSIEQFDSYLRQICSIDMEIAKHCLSLKNNKHQWKIHSVDRKCLRWLTNSQWLSVMTIFFFRKIVIKVTYPQSNQYKQEQIAFYSPNIVVLALGVLYQSPQTSHQNYLHRHPRAVCN